VKLAYVCTDPGIPVFGRKGASIHVQEVLLALARAGTEVTLFARRIDGTTPEDLRDVALVELCSPEARDTPERERTLLSDNANVRHAIRSTGPFDAIYERHALWSHAPMELAREWDVPGLLEVNAPLVREQAAYRTLHDVRAAEECARRALLSASSVLCVSEEVASFVHSFANSCRRVLVVPNGVDTERFHPGVRPTLAGALETFTVGFVGTLKPWHGVETLVRAFARFAERCPGARLLVVGDGPQRVTLEALATELGVRERSVFTGAVSSNEVPGMVASMDVACAPYPALQDFYFSPLKLFEYMASGRAVVASRVGQVTSVLRHNETALLHEPDDEHTLASHLLRLWREPLTRAALGASARERVAREHTWRATADRILHEATRSPSSTACASQGGC
jgi:glycosyltransferase involved in cell wall biosynthesis